MGFVDSKPHFRWSTGSKGYAYVDFDSPEHVAEAVEKFSGDFLCHKSPCVKVAYIFSFTNQSSLRLSVYVCIYVYISTLYIHN